MYIPRIPVENLPREYREKLRARELDRATIDSLARSVSEKYLMRKRAWTRIAIILPAATVLMIVLSLFSPAGRGESSEAALFSLGATLAMELVVLGLVYYTAVVKEPRQFSAGLQKGYPELMMQYGYEQLLNGSLARKTEPAQLPFSLEVEDTFDLQDSEDIVAVGFAHGLIERGNSVFIIDRTDPSSERACGIVSAIEKGPGKPALQAADCKVGLRIKKGVRLGVVPGVYLYREQ